MGFSRTEARRLGFFHLVVIPARYPHWDILMWLRGHENVLWRRDFIRVGGMAWPTMTYGFRDPVLATAFKIRWG